MDDVNKKIACWNENIFRALMGGPVVVNTTVQFVDKILFVFDII